MKIKEFLNEELDESLDEPVAYEKKGNGEYQFIIAGNSYRVGFEKANGNHVIIHFNSYNAPGHIKAVYSTLLKIVADYVKKNKPNSIEASADVAHYDFLKLLVAEGKKMIKKYIVDRRITDMKDVTYVLRKKKFGEK